MRLAEGARETTGCKLGREVWRSLWSELWLLELQRMLAQTYIGAATSPSRKKSTEGAGAAAMFYIT